MVEETANLKLYNSSFLVNHKNILRINLKFLII